MSNMVIDNYTFMSNCSQSEPFEEGENILGCLFAGCVVYVDFSDPLSSRSELANRYRILQTFNVAEIFSPRKLISSSGMRA